MLDRLPRKKNPFQQHFGKKASERLRNDWESSCFTLVTLWQPPALSFCLVVCFGLLSFCFDFEPSQFFCVIHHANLAVVASECNCSLPLSAGTTTPLSAVRLFGCCCLGWIAHQEHIIAQVWHTKQGVFRRKVLADVRDDPMRGQYRGRWGRRGMLWLDYLELGTTSSIQDASAQRGIYRMLQQEEYALWVFLCILLLMGRGMNFWPTSKGVVFRIAWVTLSTSFHGIASAIEQELMLGYVIRVE